MRYHDIAVAAPRRRPASSALYTQAGIRRTVVAVLSRLGGQCCYRGSTANGRGNANRVALFCLCHSAGTVGEPRTRRLCVRVVTTYVNAVLLLLFHQCVTPLRAALFFFFSFLIFDTRHAGLPSAFSFSHFSLRWRYITMLFTLLLIYAVDACYGYAGFSHVAAPCPRPLTILLVLIFFRACSARRFLRAQNSMRVPEFEAAG